MERDRRICFVLTYGKKKTGIDASHLIPVKSKEVAPTITTLSFMNLALLEEIEDK